eukprot:GHVH01017460.1.p1 GENE.GHVH01017460.1~~GHVH01017460.1.p1  ORF type:complete len:492 (-),score=62.20 GHVH01017460.1:34-1509(-)
MTIPQELVDRIQKSCQDHLLPWLAKSCDLTPEEQKCLHANLESIEWESLNELYTMTTAPPTPPNGILPPSYNLNDTTNPAVNTVLANQPKELRDKWHKIGLEAIAKGEVAACVMGGGQGTRLGFDGPKGCYKIAPLTESTLFQLFVQRVMKLRQLCVHADLASSMGDVKVPFCVMTSDTNDTATRSFFDEHCNFGYPDEDLHFFVQSMVPCFDNDGKVLIASPTSLAMNPNGNGGIFSSMQKSGTLEKLKKSGVKYVHIWGIDNVLTKCLDPTFIGYCIDNNAEAGNKCCTKIEAAEKVGVFASRVDQSGKRIATVVEYSELSSDLADNRDEAGRFVFGSGNICNHMFKLEFIERLVKCRFLESNPSSLHAAFKKIPYMDNSGKMVNPDTINGVKMEMFIFDSFWFADKVFGLEVEREQEFAPVKNAVGGDSPETARQMLSSLHIKWLKEAGATIDAKSKGLMEIAPLVSYEGEGLEDYNGETVYLGNPIH